MRSEAVSVNEQTDATVRYQNESFKSHTEEYRGQIAQIIQHECDHLEGDII